jgi:hypothetical protein
MRNHVFLLMTFHMRVEMLSQHHMPMPCLCSEGICTIATMLPVKASVCQQRCVCHTIK